MLEIRDEHLGEFKKIKEHFLQRTVIPKENNWKSRTDGEIWLELMKQVIVVGRSEPAEKFDRDIELKSRVSYEELSKVENNEKELQKRISHVLRTVGARYHNKKTSALIHNFKLVKDSGGPKSLLQRLSEFTGLDAEKKRIEHTMNFKYVKSKGARDFLMESGLIRNAVALDSRIQSIFERIGIEFPDGFISNPKIYNEMERDILVKICKPLGLSGVEFDRMLYQNKDNIMKMIGRAH